ncbi:hypothetical protein AG1IA_09315 [Rhizoctonia solani AG-1 IA]|uniref:Uncharacterized protein n=1 Tax=Thanatephorus cucumeris (strain AG1-IA) TaxID=983506 RepID=L8WEN8_THACA|nr:hypothetical protein AG1IA_09315 [Rhizoctonia solani AG-1 IA]
MPARASMDSVASIHSTEGNLDNMSEIMSVAMTDDKESTVGTIGPAAIPNPEIEHVREVIVKMKETLAEQDPICQINFDSLGEQTAKVATVPSGMETNQEILAVQRHTRVLSRVMLMQFVSRQDENIEEIKKLLREVAQEQIVEHLRNSGAFPFLADQVMEIIDDFVEEEVRKQLDEIIPVELQNQVVEQKKQLEEVRRSFEARRANALLRSTHMTDALHKLLLPSGMVSADFPDNLGELFAMDGPQAKRLLEEYGIDASESREKNLNRFMQFIGVSYQMASSIISHVTLNLIPSPQVPSQASSIGGSSIAGI